MPCMPYGQIFRDFFLESRHIKLARNIRVSEKHEVMICIKMKHILIEALHPPFSLASPFC